MKKEVVLISLIFLILILPFVISADETEQELVDKAYACLNDRVDDECSTSLEDNIFVLLATGKCRSEVLDDSDDEECWPDGDCRVKQTAQAILALDNAGRSVNDAEDWLIAKNTTPTNLDWFLEIESNQATTCTITYDGLDYSISIGEDKKISSSAGSCLALSDGSWWLKISPNCYNKEFEISCNQDFLTTLLFKQKDSSTIHVSASSNFASASGTTKEKINSYCFTDSGTCNYEGSLWAAFVLDLMDYDVSSYLPYLITESEDNDAYLPDAFLYLITGSSDFSSNLLSMQKNKHWDESGDELYDTAVALYPFQYEELTQKEDAKAWLFEEQDNDGCWGNTKNTAFILHSVWQKSFHNDDNGDVSDFDCADENYYCMSSSNCEDARGSELDYGCASPNVCCSKPKLIETCADQGGEICDSNENCVSGIEVDASDVSSNKECCVDGYCSIILASDEDECEDAGGTCRTSCLSDEQESYSYNCDYGDACCISSGGGGGGSYWWIWLLLILIILVIIGIIFRDRLSYYFGKYSPFGKKKTPPPGPGGFPMVSPAPMRMPAPRKILPPTQRRPMPRRPPQRRSSELDDVLKKLKEIGK